jgi:hypothetical protein
MEGRREASAPACLAPPGLGVRRRALLLCPPVPKAVSPALGQVVSTTIRANIGKEFRLGMLYALTQQVAIESAIVRNFVINSADTAQTEQATLDPGQSANRCSVPSIDAALDWQRRQAMRSDQGDGALWQPALVV